MKLKLFSCLAAALLIPATLSAQVQTQTTTVTKRGYDNPTIALANFNGTPEQRKQLENVLDRCGWFKLLPAQQAASAQIKLNGAMTTSPDGRTAAELTALYNGQTLQFARTEATLNMASLQITDDILAKFFGIPALCTRKIVFVRQIQPNVKELFSCYLDGSGQERLTFNKAFASEPSWGHAGALVYTLVKNNSVLTILMDCGNKRERIVSRARGLNCSAALSPDGRKVALAMSKDNIVDIYVLDLASNTSTRLTNDNAVESSPCWSPDGKTICFASDATGIGAPRLYTVPADGSQKPRRLQIGGGEAVSPEWSKQTNKLCFATRSGGKYAIATLDMSAPNAMPTIVTSADGDWEAPSWAPDGRHIVCTCTNRSGRSLMIIDTLRGSFKTLFQNVPVSLPAWQPAR